ncbi:hypothetical protein ACFL3B_01035 [Gemmatimonadota bacterium]
MPRVRLGTNKPSILISTMLLLVGSSAGAFAKSISPGDCGPLKYRHIGPPGNRLAAVAGIPGAYVAEATGRIGRALIDPRNPDVVFAASMGHSCGPQQERGAIAPPRAV